MSLPRVVILGGGPAGVGAAWRLHRLGRGEAVVIEQRGEVGGNAGSFEIDGVHVDYGSHRLHPACKPEILRDLRELLGDDLLDRPRHGRIRLRGRWLHFPLKPVDLALRMPWSFGLGVASDAAGKLIKGGFAEPGESFASVLRAGLGETICRDFYFPYARKIWGLDATQLSAIQARRRVASRSLGKLFQKVVALVPGFKRPGAGRFYYPKRGYGQISQAIADEAVRLGADLRLNSRVERIELGSQHRVTVSGPLGTQTVEAEHVWSTLPVSLLPRMVVPEASPAVREAAAGLRFRSMVLIYVVLGQDQFTPFDAHYFPEEGLRLTRLSEPKNYSASREPVGRTVLCGELPCTMDDENWRASDEALGRLVVEDLERSGLGVTAPVHRVCTRRLSHAYPIYPIGYERHFEPLDQWINSLPDLLSFGRQGLFAHDNTHHALAMAYAAVDCLDKGGRFDAERWAAYREEFATHVVED